MSNQENTTKKKGFGLMHAGMMVCCAVMLLPVAGFILAGGTIAGLFSNLSVFAPIALCIGAHVAMFAIMGKSCHSEKKDTSGELRAAADGYQASKIPVVRSK